MVQKILAVLDPSKVSQFVLESASDLAQAHCSSLLLYLVADEAIDSDRLVLCTPRRQKSWDGNLEFLNADRAVLTQQKLSGKALLDDKTKVVWTGTDEPTFNRLHVDQTLATAAGSTHFVQPSGDLRRTICDIAHREHVDLIVMGLTEKNAGVSEYVTQVAPCLVLILNDR
jgi:nucleotide-binding universal stress UspA family protein